jgi:hypothetical protein
MFPQWWSFCPLHEETKPGIPVMLSRHSCHPFLNNIQAGKQGGLVWQYQGEEDMLS